MSLGISMRTIVVAFLFLACFRVLVSVSAGTAEARRATSTSTSAIFSKQNYINEKFGASDADIISPFDDRTSSSQLSLANHDHLGGERFGVLDELSPYYYYSSSFAPDQLRLEGPPQQQVVVAKGALVHLQYQQSDADALCAFKQGITNWPSNPTPYPTLSPTSSSSASPTSFAPTRYPTISPSAFIGWNCNGSHATSFPCGTGAVTWTGVSCGNSGEVRVLNLISKGLVGTISPSLSALTGLYQLYLNGNKLTGTISPSLSTLTGLYQLYLHTNMLTGTISPYLSALTGLNQLYLYNNKLIGSIPPQISVLTNLAYLSLNNNRLEGLIPSEFSALKATKILLNLNSLGGAIPKELCDQTDTSYFNMVNNSFTCYPSCVRKAQWLLDPIPHCPGSEQDQVVCAVSETFGIPNLLKNLELLSPNIIIFQSPHSRFKSAEQKPYSMNVSTPNAFFYEVTFDAQTTVDTYDYIKICTDSICSQTFWTGGNNNSLFPGVLGNKPLRIEARSFYIECGLLKYWGIAYGFTIFIQPYTYGLGWDCIKDINGNYYAKGLCDAGSSNEWTGVRCLPNAYVSELDMHALGLEGTIPSLISKLKNLTSLDLGFNRLTGSLPTFIESMMNLEYLDLNSNQLTGRLADFSSLSNIATIALNNNYFTGGISDTILNISTLHSLRLGSNMFSGDLSLRFCDVNNQTLTLSISDNSDLCYPECWVAMHPVDDNGACIVTSTKLTDIEIVVVTTVVVLVFLVAIMIYVNFYRRREVVLLDKEKQRYLEALPIHRILVRGRNYTAKELNEVIIKNLDTVNCYDMDKNSAMDLIFKTAGALDKIEEDTLFAMVTRCVPFDDQTGRAIDGDPPPRILSMSGLSGSSKDIFDTVNSTVKSTVGVMTKGVSEIIKLRDSMHRPLHGSRLSSMDLSPSLSSDLDGVNDGPKAEDLITIPRHHGFVWHSLVHADNEKVNTTNVAGYSKVISVCDKVCKNHKKFIKILANCKDRSARKAIDIASTGCTDIMKKYLRLSERYELLDPEEHISDETIIHSAIDRNAIGENPNREVVLKFMKSKEQFLLECNRRTLSSFDPNFVVGIIISYGFVGNLPDAFLDERIDIEGGGNGSAIKNPLNNSSEVELMGINLGSANRSENILFRKDAILKGFKEYPFCIVMPNAGISLQKFILQSNTQRVDSREIREIMRRLLCCLEHVHSKGLVYGNLKPSKFMIQDRNIRVIDFDSSVKNNEQFTKKRTTAYAPPEMFSDQTLSNSSDSGGGLGPGAKVNNSSCVEASEHFDLWSLGAIMFYLTTGRTLFFSDRNDNLVESDDMQNIHTWSNSFKLNKLSKVTDKFARNLIHILMSKTPDKRLSAKKLLSHPYITGNKFVTRQIGSPPIYDVFLSYRVESDKGHVKVLYDALVARGLKVWWDVICLPPGLNWEEGFCNGLINSATFVCLLSREAINSPTVEKRNISKLTTSSNCDNVVLEWRLAKELFDMGMINGIYPIMIGDKDPVTSQYSGYFSCRCNPNLEENVVVASIENKLFEHLEREGLGCPMTPNLGLKSLINAIMSNQGKFIGDDDLTKPERQLDKAVEMTVDAIEVMVKSAKSKMTSGDD